MTAVTGGANEPTVFVIDDDSAMRQALHSLLDSVGLNVRLFASAQAFLALDLPDVPSCVVLDVRLKGQSGLAVQRHIAHTLHIPVILITAHGDIAMSVQAMKAGAVDFFAKPFRAQDMIDAIGHALEADRKRRAAERSTAVLRACYELVTPRERAVMTRVVNGMLNKQIAAELNLSEITVKLHRAQAMKKMESPSLADLVLKADALGLVDRENRLTRNN